MAKAALCIQPHNLNDNQPQLQSVICSNRTCLDSKRALCTKHLVNSPLNGVTHNDNNLRLHSVTLGSDQWYCCSTEALTLLLVVEPGSYVSEYVMGQKCQILVLWESYAACGPCHLSVCSGCFYCRADKSKWEKLWVDQICCTQYHCWLMSFAGRGGRFVDSLFFSLGFSSQATNRLCYLLGSFSLRERGQMLLRGEGVFTTCIKKQCFFAK